MLARGRLRAAARRCASRCSSVQMPSVDGVLADHLLAREARQLQERVVDAQVRPVGDARDRRRLRIEVEDRLEPALRRAQRVLGQPPVVHVERRGRPSARSRRPRPGPARRARGASDTRLPSCGSGTRSRTAPTSRARSPSAAGARLGSSGGRRRARPCRGASAPAQAGQLEPAVVDPLEAALASHVQMICGSAFASFRYSDSICAKAASPSPVTLSPW